MRKHSYSFSAFGFMVKSMRFVQTRSPQLRHWPWQVLICTVFACLALYNLVGSHNQHQALAKQRLLEIAFQDIAIQSLALASLTETRPAQLRMALLQRGFETPMHLLNHLDTRLTLLENLHTKLPNEVPMELAIKQLRQELEWLIGQYANIQNNPQEPTDSLHKHINQWHNHLHALNRLTYAKRLEEPQRLKSLSAHNTWLTFFVLALVALPLLRFVGERSGFLSIWRSHWQNSVAINKLDPLTGLHNRQAWLEYTHGILYRLRQQPNQPQNEGSVLIVRVNGLEDYRETFGEAAANTRIRECAKCLRRNYRPSDFIARVHEDQFFVVLPECNPILAQRTLERLQQLNRTLEFSAGVCPLDKHHSIEHLMALADQALYQAKRNLNPNKREKPAAA